MRRIGTAVRDHAPRRRQSRGRSRPSPPRGEGWPEAGRRAGCPGEDAAAVAYHARTGDVWRPRHGSHTSRSRQLTSAAIDARDFMRARKDREVMAHLPEGTLVAIAGGKDVADPAAVIARLDKARAKYSDMVLVHGGGPGVERIAARWAEKNGVQQIVCKPDWDKHGRAAPFRRNDDLPNLLPKGVIAFPGSGITENLVDKACQLGIAVRRIAA